MKAEAQQCSVTVPGTPGFRSHAAPGSSFCPGSHPATTLGLVTLSPEAVLDCDGFLALLVWNGLDMFEDY